MIRHYSVSQCPEVNFTSHFSVMSLLRSVKPQSFQA